MKLEEALADKLKCLLQRRYCYDLFDLVYGLFLSRDIEVDRSELMNVFLRKTIFGASPGAARSLLLDLPVGLFRGYWHKVMVPAVSRVSFDHAVDSLRSGIVDLFAPYAAIGGSELAFYPSHLRNPIMEAGSERQLIQLVYDGVTRIVEPYSLTYKRRTSDGVAQEYLYAYDVTGGRQSGPGIKTFLHFKIQGLDILDQKFAPRFEVTLAKAGDSSQSGYFRGTPGPRRSSGVSTRSTRRSQVRFSPTYVVQCVSCGKQFSRQKNNTRMNAHKNQWGGACSGRSGFVVAVR